MSQAPRMMLKPQQVVTALRIIKTTVYNAEGTTYNVIPTAYNVSSIAYNVACSPYIMSKSSRIIIISRIMLELEAPRIM
jgi:hypothetical protein